MKTVLSKKEIQERLNELLETSSGDASVLKKGRHADYDNILTLVAAGYSRDSIAEYLGLSPTRVGYVTRRLREQGDIQK